MHRGFGGTAFDPAEERRDREVTLGPTMLVAIACGLFLLCGLCFVFGYSLGHHSSVETAVSGIHPAPSPGGQIQVAGSQAKPSAAQSSIQPQQSQADVSTASAGDAPSATANSAASQAQSAVAPVQRAGVAAPSISGSTVQAALPAQSTVANPIPGAGQRVTPALPQGKSYMVQIAAVSHVEDAQVLVGALRKRGYAVTERHDPVDGLTHVQVGPFNDLVEASAMRLKLLNDGYNAIVQ